MTSTATAKKSKKRLKSMCRMSRKGMFNPIDVHVGQRIRRRRTMLGWTQAKLGAAVALSVQQIQSYECGINRVTSSRIFDLACALGAPVGWFFDEIPSHVQNKSPVRAMSVEDLVTRADDTPRMYRRETLELCQAYWALDSITRKNLRELVEALAA